MRLWRVALPWWFVLVAGVGLAWAISYADAPQIFPDTGSYLFHSWLYAGVEPAQALCRGHMFVVEAGVIPPAPCPAAPDPFGEAFYRSRLLYPLLSVPFVHLYGGAGMVVVPLLLSTVAVVGLVVVLARLVAEPIAVLVPLAAFATAPLNSMALAALTEGPIIGLEVLVLLLLPLTEADERSEAGPVRPVTVLRWVGIAAGVTAIGLTRQAAPVMGAMVALGWLSALIAYRRRHGRWSLRTGWTGPLAATVIGVALSVGWAMAVGGSLTVALFKFTGSTTWAEALERLPATLGRVLQLESETALKYPFLLLGLLLAVICLVRYPLSRPAAMLLGAVLGVALLMAASPYPTYLRVASAAAPAVVLAAGWLLGRWARAAPPDMRA